ncbi:oxygenase MpaB family protein [Salinactinospora qingdaonensis]
MDRGLFEDDAAIRAIGQEGAVLLAAGYAILMQLAHPKVAQGVYEHSDFAHRPLDRLNGTLSYVYAVVFGTRDEAERVGRAVRAAHGRISGPGYDSLDPELQVWVAATLYDGALRVTERALHQLPAETVEEAHPQYAVLATALGCPEQMWPASREAFVAYWQDMLAQLRVTDQARELVRQLRYPRNRLLRPAAALQLFVATGLLPSQLRTQYGLRWGPRHEGALRALFATVARINPLLPLAVRRLPLTVCLWNLRRRARRPRRRAAR